MTNYTKDALVAETVGYLVYHGADDKGETMYVLVSPQEMKRGGMMRWIAKHNFSLWEMKWWPDEAIEQFGGDIPPFLTAPDYATDGIVLEWVQGQDMAFTKVFSEKLLEIIWGGIPQHAVKEQLDEFVRFYKKGDYARALSEVEELPF